jgi:hypothetical protein
VGEEMKYTSVILPLFVIGFLIIKLWHPYPYNTEQVCFDKKGKIVFYAKKFNPNETPAIQLNENTYMIMATGERINATCKWSWGASPPKGRYYWE